MNAQSFFARIIKAMDALDLPSPDTTNKGTLLWQAYLWHTIGKEAERRYNAAYAAVCEAEPSADKEAIRSQGTGTYIPFTSPKFALSATVTNPSKTFNASALANALNKKYKIPVPIAREMIEAAKEPSGSAKVTLSFVEK